MNARMLAAGVLLLFLGEAQAVIFSQRGSSYDPGQNTIEMSEAWKLGHAVGDMHGCTGIAIAPQWFVTAAHLARTQPRVLDCPIGSFRIVEMAPLVGDTMLCRVDQPFARYARLLDRPLRRDEIVRVYGRSSAHWAGQPFRGSDGLVKGWKIGAEARESMRLRWGLGRLSTVEDWGLNWRFTSHDPEIGTNCAALVHMDSGGGIFLGSDLAGVATMGTQTMQPRASLKESPNDCARVYLFDPTNLFNCHVDSPLPALNVSFASAMPLWPNLDRIYAKIAPPQRVNAGGETVGEWSAWTGGYPVLAFSEVRGAASGAPAEVYRSAVYVTGTNLLTYAATHLLMTERYTLRLHFGALPFLEEGEAVHDVYINGIIRGVRFDPVRESGGTGRPVVLEIRGLEPEEGSRASITLQGVGRKRIAYLSGLELVLERRRGVESL